MTHSKELKLSNKKSNMKIKSPIAIFATAVFSLTALFAQGQYLSSDFTIITKGLSESYASRFKESSKKEELVNIFNQLNITHDIAPIKITILFEKNEGNVIAEVNYDHNKILLGDNDYSSHNERWSRYGKGTSVYLQHQIFTALSQYKKSVSTKGYSMDKELLKFTSTVKLKKATGDWISFYAYNYFNSQGFYPFTFYKNARLSVGGKIYEVETPNTKMLNEMKFFFVGKAIGLDGNKTGAYYFCKFFEIETE